MITPKFTIGASLEARTIREEVFVQEQGFRDEFDEYDETSPSLVLFLDGYPIATGRLRALNPERYKIERVAVRKAFRGKKVGTYCVKFLCTKIKTMGGRVACLHAQVDKMPFYERLGFAVVGDGEILYEEGVPHIEMEKILVKDSSRRGRSSSRTKGARAKGGI